MNTCEKKELKCVLQKLSNKLEGKTIETTAFQKSIEIASDGGITFVFPFPTVSENKTLNLKCNIQPSLPDYIEYYNDKITSITFFNNKIDRTYLSDSVYNRYTTKDYSDDNNMYLVDLQNIRYLIDLKITSTTKPPKIYENMSGLVIDPVHYDNPFVSAYCAPKTKCTPDPIRRNSSAMRISWPESYDTNTTPTCFPDGTIVKINIPEY